MAPDGGQADETQADGSQAVSEPEQPNSWGRSLKWRRAFGQADGDPGSQEPGC